MCFVDVVCVGGWVVVLVGVFFWGWGVEWDGVVVVDVVLFLGLGEVGVDGLEVFF